jgi:hypothetical protein
MQSNDEGSLMKSPMTTAQHSTLMATVNLCASTLLCFQKHGGFFLPFISVYLSASCPSFTLDVAVLPCVAGASSSKQKQTKLSYPICPCFTGLSAQSVQMASPPSLYP